MYVVMRCTVVIALVMALALAGCHASPQPPDTAGTEPARSTGPPSVINPGRDGSDARIAIDDAQIRDADRDASSGSVACKHVEVVQDCVDGWCRIPTGCFIMGSPETEFGHPVGAPVERMVGVNLTHSFLIGQHEVTQLQWTAEELPNLSTALPGDRGDCIAPDCPAGGISWFAALAFANRLSERHEPPLKSCYELKGCTGALGNKLRCAEVHVAAPTIYECEGFRLPTEAEWEYATRAGTRTAYYAGDIIPYEGRCAPQPPLEDTAWYCNNSKGHTHPVMQKRSNAWGLHDTLGNAYEWVNDDFRVRQREYEGEQVEDPGSQVDPAWTLRVWRGGLYGSLPEWNRSSSQTYGLWDEETSTVSFRLARTLFADENASPP